MRLCIRTARSYESAPMPTPPDSAVASAAAQAAFPTAEFAWTLAASLAVMLVLWARQLKTKDATSVDVGWAATIGALAVGLALTGDGSGLSRWLAAGVALVWSVRLSLHLLVDRVLRHRGEDGRYAALREHWGPRAAQRFVFVYVVQGLLAFLFATPFVVLTAHDAPSLVPIQVAGLALFGLGILVETWSDRCLAAHRRDPANKGRTCRRGPWRYSRHPNYFGEWLLWCGIGAVCSPAPHGWIAWIAPVSMYLFVRFVSGVPWTERQSLKSRGDDYRAYQRETNCFFPWFPRATAPSKGTP